MNFPFLGCNFCQHKKTEETTTTKMLKKINDITGRIVHAQHSVTEC